MVNGGKIVGITQSAERPIRLGKESTQNAAKIREGLSNGENVVLVLEKGRVPLLRLL